MEFSGMKVLIMGLGLHGGGIESARYLLRRGAELTVTDLKDERALAPALERLGGASIRYVLGRHEINDFANADMVIKNPGVRPDSPYLRAAKRVETDISLFLAASPARLTVVTGSKGKSGTASALHWALDKARKAGGFPLGTAALQGKARLGGNITVSPLTFLEDLGAEDDVVLELSSWQLGDLRGRRRPDKGAGGPLLKPKAAVLTAIMPDHLNYYATMEAYVADKRVMYQGQDETDCTVAGDDEWGRSFHAESRGRPLIYSGGPLPEGVSGGWLTGPEGPALARLYGFDSPGLAGGRPVELVPPRLLTPGYHQKKNLLAAALALLGLGLDADFIREALGNFPGIEHRLELFHRAGGIDFYNDSAATIPEAAAAALEALGRDAPLVLVAGGSDKNLDFSPLVRAAPLAKTIILLAGDGSERLCSLFDRAGVAYQGPFDSLDRAVSAALESAVPGGKVALSPGCTSFGMFLNEFDRGRRWKETVRRLA
ncbi:MAG: UDP-N-acetylmuramoyl-L-alanine--D-glutamate ligase [Treponema sp.]|jgi:UDP-N-acetylmuramoylalanine--D-glutamate ligase|nr:UDP-N-acetylmuramoyl-L-alanine--D-glutamate ligase [Treponema sp.]